jgi:type II secretory pathway pseudopilin PulG
MNDNRESMIKRRSKAIAFSAAPESVGLSISRRAARRSAFTLLEVLLALALSVMVIGAIGYAIYFHLRVLEDQRNRVEQALVARGLMQLMANDIRAGVQYKPIDMSQLESLLASTDLTTLLMDPAMAGLASGLDTGALTDSGADAGTDPAADEGTDTAATDEEEVSAPRPGLFGTANELRIDISRMPRRDEYLAGVGQSGMDFSSDLKAVIYRLAPTESLDPRQMIGLPPVSEEGSMSLVRTSVSHAVARLADESGADAAAVGQSAVLANEVQTITFRYFDGTAGEWVDEWDSEAMESLPNAVEIVMSMRMAISQVNMQELPSETYRLVVHLPMAEPPEEDSGASSDSGATDTTTGGNSAPADDTGGDE